MIDVFSNHLNKSSFNIYYFSCYYYYFSELFFLYSHLWAFFLSFFTNMFNLFFYCSLNY
jgi:hypothetical protein